MRFQNALSVAALFSVVKAHTIFVQLEVEGTTYPVSHAIRDPSYDGVGIPGVFCRTLVNIILTHQRRNNKLRCLQRGV